MPAKKGVKRKRNDPRRRSFFHVTDDDEPSSAQKRIANGKKNGKRRKSTSRSAELEIETEDGFLYKVMRKDEDDESEEDDSPPKKATRRRGRDEGKKSKSTKEVASKKAAASKGSKKTKKISVKIPSHPELSLDPKQWSGEGSTPALFRFFQHALAEEKRLTAETYTGELDFVASSIQTVSDKFLRYAEKKISQIIKTRQPTATKTNMANVLLQQEEIVLKNILEKCKEETRECEETKKRKEAEAAKPPAAAMSISEEEEALNEKERDLLKNACAGVLSEKVKIVYPVLSIKSDVVLRTLKRINETVSNTETAMTGVSQVLSKNALQPFQATDASTTKSTIASLLS